MALGCGPSVLKYLLFLFNFLFALSGLLIIIVGAVVQHRYDPYLTFVDSGFLFATVTLIVVGVVVFIISFFGCCGPLKENHCMVITFSILMIAVFLLEVAGGVAAYVKHGQVQQFLEKRFNQTIQEYPQNEMVQHSINIMQHELSCCGINGPTDWAAYHQAIPNSCCLRLVEGANCTTEEAYPKGCMTVLLPMFQNMTYTVGAVGISVAVIQLLGVVFACILARSIRNQYETV